jgi:hypothetical protein
VPTPYKCIAGFVGVGITLALTPPFRILLKNSLIKNQAIKALFIGFRSMAKALKFLLHW